jgi:DNA gyrase subunit A
MHTEENKRGKEIVVITEIPYMVNKTTLIEGMVEAVQRKDIDGVSDIRDESDRDGMRIVIELTRDGDADLVQRQIYKRSQMQSTFGVINLSLVNNQPVELSMRQTLEIFLNHRREIIRRRTQFRLNKALAREHIVEGLLKALDIIDQVISMIRGSQTAAEAKDSLVSKLGFSEIQAQAILEMRLQRLTGLERSKLDEELAQLKIDIMDLRRILADAKILDGVIRKELIEINEKFGDKRRTEITVNYDENMSVEAYISENDIVVVLSKDGYLRRKNLDEYQTQARGGKGRKGAVIQEEDAVASVTVTHTHNDVWFFTSKGRILTLKGHLIPETKTGKGKLISRIIPLEEGERVVELHGGELNDLNYGFFITRNGIAKRLEMSEMADSSRPRRIITLDDDDEIAQVRLTNGENDLLLMTEKAQCLRVCEKEFRAMGRVARGVIGMRLSEGDRVISCDVVNDNRQVLVISEKGVGKRSLFSDYTPHHRGTSGVRAMLLGAKTGKLVGCWSVGEYDEIMAITARGRIIRVAASNVRLLSRMAQGSITMRLDDGDSVVDCSVVRNSSPKISSEDNIEKIAENVTEAQKSDSFLLLPILPIKEDETE